MSGQQLGSVAGGIIGAVIGGPAGAQIGMAVGGTIGGLVDPTKVNGPRIGDGQQQTATDGSPIAWVMGTATIAGTIVQVSPRREVKIKDSGKGGPVVSHYESHQDFAILVCESCQLRDSSISSILMVTQDGKIVYDVRPGSTMLSDSAKWKAGVDFLFGDESQLPHPTLEALTGIGSTPSYRGVCLAVFRDFNTTAAGDRVPSYTFTVSSYFGANSGYTDAWSIKSIPYGYGDSADYGTNIDFDDSSWIVRPGPFGNIKSDPKIGTDAAAASPDLPAIVSTITPLGSKTIARKHFHVNDISKGSVYIKEYCGSNNNSADIQFYMNGTAVNAFAVGTSVVEFLVPTENLIIGDNVVACVMESSADGYPVYFAFEIGETTSPTGQLYLGQAVSSIASRGGLSAVDIDSSILGDIPLLGYPIAREVNAADCLTPLLQAYFAYGSEYDGKIHFDFYGADAVLTIDENDLLESTDANDHNVISTLRNQATEFPRKITVSYLDPAQNYTSVNVSAERLAEGIIAVGERSISIPVVMPADQAQQAVEKALKIAYATLEGTQEYSLPFSGKGGVYLSLCAGDAVIFRGKRWVIDETVIGNGHIKLTTRYDRQGAYRSQVQAVLGNIPSVPLSTYSGPTTLVPMNLPSLRPQDTYGLYLAAASSTESPSWRGCQVQASYDGQVTWVNALAISVPATLGLVTDAETTGGEPLTVQSNEELLTVTPAQITAQANAMALIHTTGTEIAQFETATEDATTVNKYMLTNVSRGLFGTTQSPCLVNDQFVMLDSVYFLPIDLSFKGTKVYLRAVGVGEIAENAAVVSIVYNPDTNVIHDGGIVKP